MGCPSTYLHFCMEKNAYPLKKSNRHDKLLLSRVKTYRILQHVFPISMAADVNTIWDVCSYLIIFLPPIIR